MWKVSLQEVCAISPLWHWYGGAGVEVRVNRWVRKTGVGDTNVSTTLLIFSNKGEKYCATSLAFCKAAIPGNLPQVISKSWNKPYVYILEAIPTCKTMVIGTSCYQKARSTFINDMVIRGTFTFHGAGSVKAWNEGNLGFTTFIRTVHQTWVRLVC